MIDVADSAVLDALCPMHLLLDARGVIVGAGPTIAKVYGGLDLIGQSFLSVFELRRPRTVTSIKDITGQGPQKLQLKLQSPPYTALRGIILPLNAKGAKMIVNLSFGISIIDAVRDFALTNADFATTDLAIEMLFLVEAKTAAMEASYRLNMRLQGAKIAAEQQAFTDMLTGLKNRRAIDQTLSHMLAKKKPFAVMHIDLDYFKEINDTLGHAAGDYVLQAVARNMVMETRQEDVVARVGGDEFTILLPSVAAESILRNIGRRIIRNLEEPINFHGHE
jgi:GGDEF domain-containing protein